ncbi:MAG: tetratricopeptide repeat protein [Alphaproteobacteria bacterium]
MRRIPFAAFLLARVAPERTVRWFRRHAERGDAMGQYFLGCMYAEGQGVPQDDAEAAKWFHKAAMQGNPFAQLNLGIMRAKGEGGPEDYIAAYLWLHWAAFGFTSRRNQHKAIECRDAVRSLMTPAQVAEMQRVAREPGSQSARVW